MRPPGRWRASRRITGTPALSKIRMAANPAAPAPIMATSGLPDTPSAQGALGLDQPRPDSISHHARGLVHSQLFENAAAMRIGRFVADSQVGGGFLSGLPACNQNQDLPLPLRQSEYHADGLLVGSEYPAFSIVYIDGGSHTPEKPAVDVERGNAGIL